MSTKSRKAKGLVEGSSSVEHSEDEDSEVSFAFRGWVYHGRRQTEEEVIRACVADECSKAAMLIEEAQEALERYGESEMAEEDLFAELDAIEHRLDECYEVDRVGYRSSIEDISGMALEYGVSWTEYGAGYIPSASELKKLKSIRNARLRKIQKRLRRQSVRERRCHLVRVFDADYKLLKILQKIKGDKIQYAVQDCVDAARHGLFKREFDSYFKQVEEQKKSKRKISAKR